MLHKDYYRKGLVENISSSLAPRLTKVTLTLNELVVGQPPAGKNLSTEEEDIVRIRHQATAGEDKAD
jgi:hypothetical protein